MLKKKEELYEDTMGVSPDVLENIYGSREREPEDD